MTQFPYIEIDEDMGIDYQDIPPWRSYQFYTYGNSLQELIDNSIISEIDQDGGELCSREALESDAEWKIGLQLIQDAITEALERRFYARKDQL